MVNSWLPEPVPDSPPYDIPIETGMMDNMMIIMNDDPPDNDNISYDGYEPLALEPNDDNDQEESSEDEAIEAEIPPSNPLPPIVPVEQEIIQEVWNAPPSRDIEMNEEKEVAVILAMRDFMLPESSIPEWASNVSEESWKAKLLDRIKEFGIKPEL